MKRVPLQRVTPLRQSRPREQRTPLARQSVKRRKDSVLRRTLVADYLAANPVCARCWKAPSTDVHEKQKRSRNPDAWLTPELFAALCRRCHEWTEAEPAAATDDGWLLPSWWRLGNPMPEPKSDRSWS